MELNPKKIFVAGPYNDKDDVIKQYRINTITEYCVNQFLKGNSPISALLMGLVYANYYKLPTDTNTWLTFSQTLLKGCDELHVLMVNGWNRSSGVKAEIEAAEKLKIEIKYISI